MECVAVSDAQVTFINLADKKSMILSAVTAVRSNYDSNGRKIDDTKVPCGTSFLLLPNTSPQDSEKLFQAVMLTTIMMSHEVITIQLDLSALVMTEEKPELFLEVLKAIPENKKLKQDDAGNTIPRVHIGRMSLDEKIKDLDQVVKVSTEKTKVPDTTKPEDDKTAGKKPAVARVLLRVGSN